MSPSGNDGPGAPSPVAQLETRIGAACARAGREPGEVVLVGASKRQSLDRMRAAYDAGLRRFGENRVQEAEEKQPALPSDIEWHLLGPLQSNKVRRAVQLFDVVHSVDRLKVLRALEREASAAGRRLQAFLEVNLGAEESKHGFAPGAVAGAADELAGCRALGFAGLMAIPPPGERPEDSRPWFRRLRALRDELRERHGEAFAGGLSMGMSDDFEVAIEEGATHVRIGTALFGPRG
ncbi:MAG TPA: YggS family pyridoxal phosphate-dependent enzyme [Thermoanaerobaculia bacterium]|nr:YggS family pyridoxal phosphate-dependent enzyme [Thermoanaerobaculia bacterium]